MPHKSEIEIDKLPPLERAKEWLERMDMAAHDCDMALFTIFSSNVFSNAEHAYHKGDITRGDMAALKESAAYKVTEFLKNCECRKKK